MMVFVNSGMCLFATLDVMTAFVIRDAPFVVTRFRPFITRAQPLICSFVITGMPFNTLSLCENESYSGTIGELKKIEVSLSFGLVTFTSMSLSGWIISD